MSKFNKAVREIAKREGISRKEVYREMQKAVDIGFANPDPLVRAAWHKVPLSFKKPRPQDIYTYCSKKVRA